MVCIGNYEAAFIVIITYCSRLHELIPKRDNVNSSHTSFHDIGNYEAAFIVIITCSRLHELIPKRDYVNSFHKSFHDKETSYIMTIKTEYSPPLPPEDAENDGFAALVMVLPADVAGGVAAGIGCSFVLFLPSGTGTGVNFPAKIT